MRKPVIIAWLGMGLFGGMVGLPAGAPARPAPPAPLPAGNRRAAPQPVDVPPNHWARQAVLQVLQDGVMALPDGRAFHGEAKVTHTQAVIALAKLAQALEAGTWRAVSSRPVPDRLMAGSHATSWQQQPVTRYVLAETLARLGNYIANGLPRPGKDSKDLGQSVVLPGGAAIGVPRTHPAYASLAYLTHNRMIWPHSPLLKPDNKPILGAELSTALAQMTAGLTDRLTSLGHDANGDTIDINSPGIKKPRR
ncbi:MAG TPA: hypothetical protein VFB38_13915 [Chthonomonadaceae bacterium]|nr:hypothetical protein [Chthonomonadaceae bacterium]